MEARVIEVTNGIDWGSYLVCRTVPADFVQAIDPLFSTGQVVSTESLWVLDLRWGVGSLVAADGTPVDPVFLVKVSPLFRPFLSWLWTQDLTCIDGLPPSIDLSPEVQVLRSDNLIVELIAEGGEYQILSVRDDTGQSVTAFDLDRIEHAIEAESVRRKKPMERARHTETPPARRNVG